MGWQKPRKGYWSACADYSWATDKCWGERLSGRRPIQRPAGPAAAATNFKRNRRRKWEVEMSSPLTLRGPGGPAGLASDRKPNTTVSSSSVWKIRFCFREHIPFPIVPPGPRAAAAPAAAVPSSPPPERAPQQRPPQKVAGHSMRRRRETQKRGPRGSGAHSAPARRGARSHRRRLGSGRQTFARLALRECPGPGGGPPHTSERALPAPVPRRRLPFFLLPTFWLGCPRRRSESRPGRSPPPRGGSHCATLLPPKGGGARPTKRPDSRRRLRVRPAGVVDGRGPAGPAGFGGRRAGVTDGVAEPRPPPPPTQLTCHPRPRYSGQRDSGRKSHSGSPLIGPVRAAAPSLRGGSAGLDWTPALSVRPRGRAFPPTAGAREGLRGQRGSLAPGCAHVERGQWAGAADPRDGSTVSIICVAERERSCQWTLAPTAC
ncbi:proline-rich protein 2-like [Meles meles]|uniref:proline-rich protein 2-like n=1 Tax=Meles meles TaxID=9662 RepID=UPI001E69EE97|nr:proline-rich protein 2-like [Meles meles]